MKIKMTDEEAKLDIYGRVPIGMPVASFYTTLDMVGSAEHLAEVPGEEFLPWAFFKHDDYRLTM